MRAAKPVNRDVFQNARNDITPNPASIFLPSSTLPSLFSHLPIPHTLPFLTHPLKPLLLPPLNHYDMIPLARPALADLGATRRARLEVESDFFKLGNQAAADFPA
jgi:hypothetical protein